MCSRRGRVTSGRYFSIFRNAIRQHQCSSNGIGLARIATHSRRPQKAWSDPGLPPCEKARRTVNSVNQIVGSGSLSDDTKRSEWREHRWLVVAAAMGVGLSAVPGYTIGVFVQPLSQEFRWPPGDVVLGISLMSLIVGIAAAVTGFAVDRWGTRRLALTGTLVICGCFVSFAFMRNSHTLFYGIWAVLALGITFASPMVWLKPVVDSFTATRGLAVSVTLCGSNFVGAIAPMLAATVIEIGDWRRAFLALSAFMLLGTLPVAWFCFFDSGERQPRDAALQRTDERSGSVVLHGIDVPDAVRTRNFWCMAIAFCLAGLGINCLLVHLVPMLVGRGISALLAASAVSSWSIAAIAGRLIAGALMDRCFAPTVAAIALFLAVLACLTLIWAPPSFGMAIVAAILVGLSVGAEFNMLSFLTARYFGPRRFGAISGLMFGIFTIGCVMGPPIAAWILAARGSYVPALAMLAIGFSIAAGAMLLCTPYPNWSETS